MSTLTRKLSKSIFESPALPLATQSYLKLIKILYKGPTRRRQEAGQAVFISFPYNSLGDVITLVSSLEYLHKAWPTTRIDVALGHVIAPFLSSIPFVRIIPVRTVSHRGVFLWRLREIQQLVHCYLRQLRNTQYDLSISPRWGSDAYARASRYLMYLAPSNKYISYAAEVDGGPATLDRLSTDTAAGGEMDPESLRHIKLLQRVGLLPQENDVETLIRSETRSLVAIAESMTRAQVESFLYRIIGRKFGEFIVVSPGASRANNRWPAERFAELLVRLNEQYDLPILAVGAPADAVFCDTLSDKAPGVVFSLGGKTTLLELAAIIRRARLFIGNDSGPGHMAGCLGVRTVVLTAFAQSSDQAHRHSAVRWRPNGPCVAQIGPQCPSPPCKSGCDVDGAHCILQVEPEEVFAAAAKFLNLERQNKIVQ